jgi:hypothetical protein
MTCHRANPINSQLIFWGLNNNTDIIRQKAIIIWRNLSQSKVILIHGFDQETEIFLEKNNGIY